MASNCQELSGEPEAERGSRCRKSEVLSDLEGRQRRWTDQRTTVQSEKDLWVEIGRNCDQRHYAWVIRAMDELKQCEEDFPAVLVAANPAVKQNSLAEGNKR